MNLQNLEIKSNEKRINYRDLMIFIVPILIFGLYLFIYNPGILTTESFNQLHQIAGGEFTNRFPFFHSFIEMILLNIFGTPLSVAALQILVFSTIWTVICKYHRDDASKSSNKFVAQFIVTLIICLIPINAVYSITLWKEILFSYGLLFLSFLIKVLIDRNGQISMKLAIIMAITIAVTSQLSLIGLPIAIITLVAVLVYIYMKNGNTDRTFLMLPAITIVLILIIGSLSMAYNVEDAHINNQGGAPMVWSVLRGDDWNGQAYYITKDGAQLKEAQNLFYTKNNITPTAGYEKLTSANLGEANYNLVNSFAVYFKDHTLTDTLFYSPALYMYLAIILLIALQLVTKTKDMYLVYVPNLINIIGVFLTCSQNENRFLYPNLLIFYLLVIIFISIYFRGSLKSLPITMNADKAKEPSNRTYQSQPAYEHAYDVSEDHFERVAPQADSISYDEIESLLDETPQDSSQSIPQTETHSEEEYDSDLIDEILKEIEMEKQNKD